MKTLNECTHPPAICQAFFRVAPPAFGDPIVDDNDDIVGWRVWCPWCREWESVRTPNGAEGFVVQAACGSGLYLVLSMDLRAALVERLADYLEGEAE